MSYGIRVWGDGWVYDTSNLSWMVADANWIVRSDRNAVRSYPHLAGYGFEAKVLSIPEYDPFDARTIWNLLRHKVTVSYSGGYPTVHLESEWSQGAGADTGSWQIERYTVRVPVHIYVFVR
ncbi:hypothetical protein [Thioalkalivibrio sp. ARh3]|uniref:hypothetical protein n=1 Tax=Thioalkalivibrio sp. ARh3 TaxID=1158148 RepID=UPI00037431E7|nr:hypothetical protein [Thioalkalivibrio sp. ARh3]